MFDYRKVSGKLAIISVVHFQLLCILGVRSWSCLTEENKKPSQLTGLRFGFGPDLSYGNQGSNSSGEGLCLYSLAKAAVKRCKN